MSDWARRREEGEGMGSMIITIMGEGLLEYGGYGVEAGLLDHD